LIHKFISWQGQRVHVSVTGEGEPLLLMAGLGASTEMWAPFLKHFPESRIIRFDAPGTGRSTTPPFPIPVAALSGLAAAVLDTFDVICADVVGFSYGGAVAQQFAFEHPQRVSRLVLAATTCGVYGVPGSFNALAGLLTPLRYYSPTYFERTAGETFGGVTGRDPAVRRRMMEIRRQNPPTPYGYAMQLLGAIGWDSWALLPYIPHETLVLNGDDDPLIPIANARLLASRLPRARIEIVPDAGHLFLWDDVDNLAKRINRFLYSPRRNDDGPAADDFPRPFLPQQHEASAFDRAASPDYPF
jgi:pimeloyl-ACP methyl ester carboxylesterase